MVAYLFKSVSLTLFVVALLSGMPPAHGGKHLGVTDEPVSDIDSAIAWNEMALEAQRPRLTKDPDGLFNCEGKRLGERLGPIIKVQGTLLWPGQSNQCFTLVDTSYAVFCGANEEPYIAAEGDVGVTSLCPQSYFGCARDTVEDPWICSVPFLTVGLERACPADLFDSIPSGYFPPPAVERVAKCPIVEDMLRSDDEPSQPMP